jgi:hypothetical protein
MIAVIDTASSVRHTCFNTLTEMGISVAVFHSPDTFVNSGAIYKASLLILGKTRVCLTKSEPLIWAGFVRPHLRTVLPGLGEIELWQLGEIRERVGTEMSQPSICDCLAEMRTALRINNASMHPESPVNTGRSFR